MSIALASVLILGIITGCVVLALTAHLLTERLARRMTAASLIRSAEALLQASAAHRTR